LTATAEITGYNTPTETVSNSIGLTIVRGLQLQIWIEQETEDGGNVRELTLLAKNV
jgi:hypothetical protein